MISELGVVRSRYSSTAGLLPGLALFLICTLSACAGVRSETAVPHREEGEAALLSRVQTVAFPILLASADRCPFDQEGTYGFVLEDGPLPDFQARSESERGIVVSQVYVRSPAAQAGLQTGDQLIEINTRDVSTDAASAASDLVRRLTRARVRPLQLDVMRSGHRLRLWLDAAPFCQFTLSLLRSDVVNAMSNGRQIVVTTGLMRFVRSDDELAWVLAHEIAHNVMGHAPDARLRVMLDTWLGATSGKAASPSPSSRSLEVQADYVGAYLMARAGYDLEAVREFWRRLGQMHSQQADPAQEFDQSHPTTEERIKAFETTLKEIEPKLVHGEALDPLAGRH